MKENEILEATIIFINNYAFEPSLDLHIKNMLADCHAGTRIISTKAYATGTKRVNMRNLGDVESIMEVTQLKTVKQPTSWTPNTVPYFLHTVTQNKVCRLICAGMSLSFYVGRYQFILL
ncbi:unnamed protein product [Heligmosomoides polygyrus]|uniref:Histone-lysine N-methyltransferase, H3 lysine-79 specific n=1 Tax=Heligmosomoides polygyrus TaxID=6339 RepID=A0A3P8DHJ6_HELPZ|nr:unnamed protein product [Heligmosomoides polygyrus]